MDSPEWDVDEPDPGRVAAILYTSGTTSRAKGVMVTDANYVAVGNAVADHSKVTARDRWLIVLPLFHANAQYYCTRSALVRGASEATLASLFSATIRMILAGAPPPGDAENRLRTVLFGQNLTAADAAPSSAASAPAWCSCTG